MRGFLIGCRCSSERLEYRSIRPEHLILKHRPEMLMAAVFRFALGAICMFLLDLSVPSACLFGVSAVAVLVQAVHALARNRCF